jgi:hypothetical protein
LALRRNLVIGSERAAFDPIAEPIAELLVTWTSGSKHVSHTVSDPSHRRGLEGSGSDREETI